MKKVIICGMLLIVTCTTYCQLINPAPTLTKEDYYKKSYSQKTMGKIFLGAGGLIAGIGLGITLNNVGGIFDPASPPKNEKLADILGYSGLGIMAASIPFFISSSKNKKKARSMSYTINPAIQIKKGSMVNTAIPSLSLKINF